jgi:hypothetical protein
MVYPVSGGLAQQIPAANTFQPGAQAVDNKNQAQENRLDTTKLSGTETARSQSTDTKNFQRNEVYSESGRSQDTGGVSASSSRGTSIDITV